MPGTPPTTARTGTGTGSAATAAAKASTAAAKPGLQVARVIDGDTVELTDKTTIRVAGIDTPERGQCGYTEATAALRTLVTGHDVTLVKAGKSNADRYGRLIRYVEVRGVDVGMDQLQAGLAIARYDSRDGYGKHPREAAYIAADKAAPNPHCPVPQKKANPAPTGRPSTASATRAAAPVPAKKANPPVGASYANCDAVRAAGKAPLRRGEPGYRSGLDRDGDGVACER